MEEVVEEEKVPNRSWTLYWLQHANGNVEDIFDDFRALFFFFQKKRDGLRIHHSTWNRNLLSGHGRGQIETGDTVLACFCKPVTKKQTRI